jgi:hypothetical protein
MSSKSFGSDIAQSRLPTTAGEVEIPAIFRDGSVLGLVYRVDPGAARDLISQQRFDPLLVFGKAVVLFAVFEHRDFTGGPYNEVALGVLVRRSGTKISALQFSIQPRTNKDAALLILNLAVNTQIALVAGIELWGYPKYLADIKTKFQRSRVDISVGSEFSLTHSSGIGCSIKCPALATYSIQKDRVIRTVIECAHRIRLGGARSVSLELGGGGPTADSLRHLGLAGLRPWLAFRSDAERMILPLGLEVGTAS